MEERLRGSQGWAELEPPPDIRLLFDVEEVLRHQLMDLASTPQVSTGSPTRYPTVLPQLLIFLCETGLLRSLLCRLHLLCWMGSSMLLWLGFNMNQDSSVGRKKVGREEED